MIYTFNTPIEEQDLVKYKGKPVALILEALSYHMLPTKSIVLVEDFNENLTGKYLLKDIEDKISTECGVDMVWKFLSQNEGLLMNVKISYRTLTENEYRTYKALVVKLTTLGKE